MNPADMFGLDDRVAVVTGGGGLIGSSIVEALAAFGATVYSAEPEAAESDIASGRALSMDISRPGSIDEAIASVVDRHGKLDIWVNCAYPRTEDWGASVDCVTPESWNANIEWHMGGYFFASRAAAEVMKTGGGGTIINLASIYGVVGPDFDLYEGTGMGNAVEYAAIKGGIISFTRYIATRYGEYGVRANCVSPGGMFADQPQPFLGRYEARTPLGRMGAPADVTGVVLLLASDAGGYITGQNLIVDGGWTAW